MSTAVIIGAGSGLSASLARKLAGRGYDLVLAARNIAKLGDLAKETSASCVEMDGSNAADMQDLFAGLRSDVRVAIYNPSARQRGPLIELDPETVRKAIEVTAFGSFLLGQEAAKCMLQNKPIAGCRGTIVFTGASAGIKGFARSAPFAMGKFAQRGLAQSMSRELHPQGVHVAWVNVDGGISNPDRPERTNDGSDNMLNPEAIAESYLQLIDQNRSAWSHELTLRPWVESF